VRTRESLLQAQKAQAPNDWAKPMAEVSKMLLAMKQILLGEGEPEGVPNQDLITALANEVYEKECIPLLLQDLVKLEFEAKKDLTVVFGILLRRQVGNRLITVEFLSRRPDLLTKLVVGFENPDIAFSSAAMIRECAKHEPLCRIILTQPTFYNFFKYIQLPQFDLASAAFDTFRDLLSSHKQFVAEFLEANYTQVMDHYTTLLKSENYVTKRQSLKLLSELLLDRTNFTVMTTYISNPTNLKLVMNLLRDKSRSVQYETFHIFKVFVANPNKTPAVLTILQSNRDKLLQFLTKFQADREEEQFADEKSYLIKQIEALPPA